MGNRTKSYRIGCWQVKNLMLSTIPLRKIKSKFYIIRNLPTPENVIKKNFGIE